MTPFPRGRQTSLAWQTILGITQKFLLITATAILIGGCARTMQGIVRSEGTPLIFFYQQEMDFDTYTVGIDGEKFFGRVVMVNAEETFSTAFGNTFGATSPISSLCYDNLLLRLRQIQSHVAWEARFHA